MEITAVRAEFPEGANIIIGQAHFIKTIEDLYERVTAAAPNAKFGVAFSEASEKRLIRVEGNSPEMKDCAAKNALTIASGHVFVIAMKEAYPISVLNEIKGCEEVCRIFCATANPLEVIIAETSQGRGVIGVIDGSTPVYVEGEEDRRERRELVRKIGYKL